MNENEVDALQKRVAALEVRVAALEGSSAESERKGKKLSVKEFLLGKSPRSDVEKTLVIGAYLEKFERLKSFSTKDIGAGFRRAKEKVPANIADMIQKNVAKGYMDLAEEERDGLKAYYLTNSGERAVNQISWKTNEDG